MRRSTRIDTSTEQDKQVDPGERLDAGQAAAAEGRFEDALREYQWFHDEALGIEPAYCGVRLSFALAYWVELGERYPPALEALRSVRDRKTDRILAGEGTPQLFHDVEAINREIGESSRTHSLFRRLVELDPESARSCSDLALPSLVEARDFELAARFLPDVDAIIEALAGRLNAAIDRLQQTTDPSTSAGAQKRRIMAHAHAENFADGLRMRMQVLGHTGRGPDAASLRVQAIAAIADDAVRQQVRRLLPEGS